jgi:glucosamine--fructose-6-phosphate aminotransferase (isomerizing)
MNLKETRYSKYSLVKEMMQTAEVIRNFNPDRTKSVATKIKSAGKLLLTGEGSSRIFPAKNAIRKSLRWGMDMSIFTDGSRQATQYDLSEFAVFCASNSGKTKEIIELAIKLKEVGNVNRFGLTANHDTPLENVCSETYVLDCGWEKAVAATKSVVEQALFYESILWNIRGLGMHGQLGMLSAAMENAMTLPIDPKIIDWVAKAETIYFAGYNDGVAEELTLKTNEIAHRKSDFLEGTYAAHGIEEVLKKNDIVFIVDPIDIEIPKFEEVLVKGVGLNVVAIADRDTPFTTIKVPSAGEMTPYVYLAAGWNLLVEIGLGTGIDLDKAERARKVGNEFTGK